MVGEAQYKRLEIPFFISFGFFRERRTTPNSGFIKDES